MSLLIKALDKAQNAKAEELQAQNVKAEQAQAQNANVKTAKNSESKKTKEINSTDMELSLSPADSAFSTNNATIAETKPNNLAPPITAKPQPSAANLATPQTGSTSAATQLAKNAANVFSAKGVETSNQNTRLALIAGAGLIALLAMGLYFYQFIDNSPDVFVAPRPPVDIAVAPQPLPAPLPEKMQEQAPQPSQASLTQNQPETVAIPVEFTEPAQAIIKQEAPIKKVAKKLDAIDKDTLDKEMLDKNAFEEIVAGEDAVFTEQPRVIADNSEDTQASAANVKPVKKTRQTKKNAAIISGIASESASIQVSKSNPQSGINPTLMSAYEAYNAGNDKDAIKLYKQVLQRDVRNVDVLLGLGAIATRQGRAADANGWYGKVLEVDPRNNIAQAAMLDSQSQGNEQANETRLKNMLAKQPNDANLHVALGNLYAEQNQWPAAQQAYFDAYSINKTADNAFNLAVSLDQMGKPKLALPYYQRALEQVSASSNIDKSALAARIAAIQ